MMTLTEALKAAEGASPGDVFEFTVTAEEVPEWRRIQAALAAPSKSVMKRLAVQQEPASAPQSGPIPFEAIGRLVNQAMDQAVANGANNVSMPDELVEIACWLAASQATEQPADRAQRDEPVIHCPEKRKPGGCQLHNLHCGWPECNKPPASRVEDEALHLAQAMAWVHRGDHAYLPQTEEQVSTWQPHAWVLTAIRAALQRKGD